MKRKHNSEDDHHQHHENNSSSSPSAKHVKFNPSSSSSSSSEQSSSLSSNNNTNTDNNKFTMESIREAKSLRRMQQLEGFENTTSILGQVNQDKLEGEEGDLNEERFQDDSNHLIEHFHLEKERHEGIFNDGNEKKKKNKNHRVLKKVINEEESFDSSDDEDGDENKEKDEWADNLEEMTLYKNNNTNTTKNNNTNNNLNNDNNTEKEIPSMEECYEFIVNNLNDKKEKISTGLERLKKDNINIYNELIKIINILISYYNQYDIYDKKREYFQKQVKWYYKAKGDETIHGPFKTSEILDWSEYLNDENLDGIKNNLDLKFNLFSSFDFNKFN